MTTNPADENDDQLREIIDAELAPLGVPPLNLNGATPIEGKVPTTDGTPALDSRGWRWPTGEIVAATSDGVIWVQQPEDDPEHLGETRVVGVQAGRVIVHEHGTLGVWLD